MAIDYNYLARERALQMAQTDWHTGVIAEDQVVTRARQYEAYLAGRPILAAGIETPSGADRHE